MEKIIYVTGCLSFIGSHVLEYIFDFDNVCKENNIDHLITKSNTQKTNGMVERANGTIKKCHYLKRKI